MRDYIINNAAEASAATFDAPANSGVNVQIAYNRATGDVITTEHASANDWTRYSDPNISTICYTCKHMSADAIKAAIIERLEAGEPE